MARSGIMLCQPFEEKRLRKWVPPYIVQPKLDGERCRAIKNPACTNWTLFSSEVHVFNSVPHIQQALRDQLHFLKDHFELDGELYCHGRAFEDIHSVVSRTVNLHPNFTDMQYHIFDLVSAEPQILRTLQLSKLDLQPPLIRVEYYLCQTLDDIMRAYDKILSEGYEGIVVRHYGNSYVRKRSLYMMKFKPKKDDYYKIVGCKEEISIHGEPKGRLGSLICAGGNGDTFSVGSGLTNDMRIELWGRKEELKGKLVHVKYQHITSGKGVPRFPIFVDIVEAAPQEVLVGI